MLHKYICALTEGRARVIIYCAAAGMASLEGRSQQRSLTITSTWIHTVVCGGIGVFAFRISFCSLEHAELQRSMTIKFTSILYLLVYCIFHLQSHSYADIKFML